MKASVHTKKAQTRNHETLSPKPRNPGLLEFGMPGSCRNMSPPWNPEPETQNRAAVEGFRG